ncbi:hypothetical protein BS78_05G005000 [Paspalum vaginatum]|nr:hypothetical protein BS78_05G005000 [Paspalum vaginatum]
MTTSMSSAYSRPSSKLPAKVRLMRSLTSKMEPKKLGVSVVAGCCLALLTYVSLAKLFAIYSPVFASTANTSAALMPPPSSSSKPSVPETEAIPPQESETLLSGTDDGDSNDGDAAAATDPVVDDLPAAAETAAGSEDAVDEAVVAEKRKKETAAVLGEEPGMKPRMVIVSRAGTPNRVLNLDAVATAASELGFNVTAAEAEAVPGQVVNSADVLLAVHGAGLAADQIAFLPARAVVMQIIVPPWGRTTTAAATDVYGGRPELRDLQLRYLEYSVVGEEGWQDVSVDLTKFRPFLLQALDRLQE